MASHSFFLISAPALLTVPTSPGTLYYLAVCGENSTTASATLNIRAKATLNAAEEAAYKIKNYITGTTIDTITAAAGEIACLTFIAPTAKITIENLGVDSYITLHPVIQ